MTVPSRLRFLSSFSIFTNLHGTSRTIESVSRQYPVLAPPRSLRCNDARHGGHHRLGHLHEPARRCDDRAHEATYDRSLRSSAHLSKEFIVHKDLAARNVLVDETYRCKVSDFGLSRLTGSKDNGDLAVYISKNDSGPCKL